MKTTTYAACFSLAFLSLSWMSEAAAQDRRPCVAPNSPAGCVSLERGPRQRGGIVPSPDNPGVVPLNDSPIAKAARAPDEWQPPSDWNKGTVTVQPGAAPDPNAKPQEQQPAPEQNATTAQPPQ